MRRFAAVLSSAAEVEACGVCCSCSCWKGADVWPNGKWAVLTRAAVASTTLLQLQFVVEGVFMHSGWTASSHDWPNLRKRVWDTRRLGSTDDFALPLPSHIFLLRPASCTASKGQHQTNVGCPLCV